MGRTFIEQSLVDKPYDYVSVAYPVNTTEVYTFKKGGSSGLVVSIVTVVYTDDTKESLSTVTRT